MIVLASCIVHWTHYSFLGWDFLFFIFLSLSIIRNGIAGVSIAYQGRQTGTFCKIFFGIIDLFVLSCHKNIFTCEWHTMPSSLVWLLYWYKVFRKSFKWCEWGRMEGRKKKKRKLIFENMLNTVYEYKLSDLVFYLLYNVLMYLMARKKSRSMSENATGDKRATKNWNQFVQLKPIVEL